MRWTRYGGLVQANPPYCLWRGIRKGRGNMPSVRLVENVPCAWPKCVRDGTKWCDDARFIPFAEDEHAGAWFCRQCAWKPKRDLDAAFIVPATIAWDAWAEIESIENAVDDEG